METAAIELAAGETLDIVVRDEAPAAGNPAVYVPVDLTGCAVEAKLTHPAGDQAITAAIVAPAVNGEIHVLAMPAQTVNVHKGLGARLWVGVTPPNGRRRWLLSNYPLSQPGTGA
jgi:hypothetical protein